MDEPLFELTDATVRYAPGFAPPAWDRGAFRAQMLDCPGGKILRLDPKAPAPYAAADAEKARAKAREVAGVA